MEARSLIAAATLALAGGLSCGGCVSPTETLSASMTGTSGWVRNLSGGASGDGDAVQDAELTPAERKMREQSRAFQRTVWEGALIGAGAGALWAAIQSGDTKDIIKGAVIGGAVGGLAGAYIAHKQKQYADKEDQLESMIADVRESNRETEALIASARQVIAEDKRRLASVQKRYKAGQATQAELAQTKARIADNGTVIAQATKGAREKQSMFQGAERAYRERNPGSDTQRLQQELDSYGRQIDALDGLADSVAVA